ncbi:uncharacterized protein LOC132515178 [Lagenorhynchus albirostris]|uniref:uncharacterized protein LOC132515178 n=1 Tax=Lagenorhynchus albirostris TaxID=27610 RepID=UPI0028EDEBF5|nr:uncharacterized protein LOC132515178 [Lagenorhynchus albirostris]
MPSAGGTKVFVLRRRRRGHLWDEDAFRWRGRSLSGQRLRYLLGDLEGGACPEEDVLAQGVRESEQGVTQAAGKGPEKGCGRERSIPSCHHEGAQPARWKRSSASAQSFQIRASGRSLQSPESLLQSRDGLVSSPRGNAALQRFLCTRGFPTPPSLSFQSWFPLIAVQHPGQSPGPLPGWGPPPGSCPAPRLAHLFRDVIGIIGLWRTQGCHLPLGSIWDTGKAGQHGPCALIPRARHLRGKSWEQSGRRADRCHCGDLEGGLRVTTPWDLEAVATGQRGECWIVSSLLSLAGKAHGRNNQRGAQPSSPPVSTLHGVPVGDPACSLSPAH